MTMSQTTAQTNRQLIEDYYAVIGGADRGRQLPDFFSDDVVWHVPRSNPTITPNPRVGLAAVMDLLTAGVGVYKEGSMRINIQSLIADEKQVAARFEMTADLANGNDYRNQYCFVFSVANNRINGVWEYLDTLYQANTGVFDNI